MLDSGQERGVQFDAPSIVMQDDAGAVALDAVGGQAGARGEDGDVGQEQEREQQGHRMD